MAVVPLFLLVQPSTQKVELTIEEAFVANLLTEVLSDLNRLGASQFYGDNPNLQQLVHHYCQTRALTRFLGDNQRFLKLEISQNR